MGQRKARKKKSLGNHPDRNAQFENISRLKSAYLKAGKPVISVDTKKKELIGNFAREGTTQTQTAVETLDHDFSSAGEGKVIPHGILDLARNEGFMHLNMSHDTCDLFCDSVAHWWLQHSIRHYPSAKELLILCDGGGSNSSHHHVFKEALQNLANRLGLKIRIAHYPPYTSKHNPIEHKLFPHITRACQGLVFHTLNIVKDAMGRAHTRTGLKVVADILTGVYQTGKKYGQRGRGPHARFRGNCGQHVWRLRHLQQRDLPDAARFEPGGCVCSQPGNRCGGNHRAVYNKWRRQYGCLQLPSRNRS